MSVSSSLIWFVVLAGLGLLPGVCALSGLALADTSCLILVAYACAGLAILRLDRIDLGLATPFLRGASALIALTCIGKIGAVLSYVAMRHSGPMTDHMLSGADTLLGLDWRTFRTAIEARPGLLWLMDMAYSACFTMPLVVIVSLSATHRWAELNRFVIVFGVALAATVAVAVAWPAEAAFAYFAHPAPPPNAVAYGAIIDGLRDGSLRTIHLTDLGGIITFPSFHATMAVLFAWASWPVRIIRVPMTVINGAMWVSAMPIGGHYAVDLIGGSVIGIGAILSVGAWRRHRSPILSTADPVAT